MLKELRIKNLAIIDDLTVSFGKGMNVLTGETGAGKSIIVDALGLALGDRAQSEMIKSGRTEASVQAFFDFDRPPDFADLEIDVSEGFLIRRTISSAGKGRAYINDSMVTIQTLSQVGRLLVDIMSQHEHQSLLSTFNQRDILDRYGRLDNERDKVAGLYHEVEDLKREVGRLKEAVKERAHRIDLLRFQIDEIDAANLATGEKPALEQQRRVLSNLGRLGGLAGSAYSIIYESEGSCLEKLSQVRSLLREMSNVDPSMDDAVKTIDAAIPLIEDASIMIRGYRDGCEDDPARLEFIEERLDLIKRLERKYGEAAEAIMKYRDDAATELEGLESADERLSEISGRLGSRESELIRASSMLSERRKKTASELEVLISDTLRHLAFGNPAFGIEVRAEVFADGRPKVGVSGFDHIEFIFSANPGEPLKPLSKIVSGGELSRVMLALKSVLAEVDNTPVLIFDEVDAGIGGSAAESVGKRLDLLSEGHQVICITHLPQIASHADCHLKIEKNAADGRVRVGVSEITGRDRKNEIARMLSGSITDISLKHAGELLEKVR